jgi:chemotaxis family two-component system response regulator Rcp1
MWKKFGSEGLEPASRYFKKGSREMNKSAKKKFEILLVEDNWADVLLAKIAFKKSKFAGNLNIVTDGEQALLFLNQEDPYSKVPVPDLVLLDLNLPRMDGRTFLRRVKSQPKFMDLKIVVLTSSQLDSDVREVLDMRANGYLVKPLELQGFFKMVDDLMDFLVNSKALPLKSIG